MSSGTSQPCAAAQAPSPLERGRSTSVEQASSATTQLMLHPTPFAPHMGGEPMATTDEIIVKFMRDNKIGHKIMILLMILMNCTVSLAPRLLFFIVQQHIERLPLIYL